MIFDTVWEKIQKKAIRMVAERLNRDIESYHLHVKNDMENLKRLLKAGDVILVEGNKLISRVVMAVTHSTWSHSGLYIGNGKIIDPLPSTGTAINGVDVYMNFNIRVCRPIASTEEQLCKVCDFASSHVGRGYDHINISNILFSFFKKKLDRTDFIGDISNSNEVCSGLIAEAFNQVGYTIIDGVNFSQIVPGDFDLSPYFEIVKFNRGEMQQFGKQVAKVWGENLETIQLKLNS